MRKQGGELFDENIFHWKMACYQNRNLLWEDSAWNYFCLGCSFWERKHRLSLASYFVMFCVQGLISRL